VQWPARVRWIKPTRKKDVNLNGQVHGHLNNILSKNEILRAIKQVFRTSLTPQFCFEKIYGLIRAKLVSKLISYFFTFVRQSLLTKLGVNFDNQLWRTKLTFWSRVNRNARMLTQKWTRCYLQWATKAYEERHAWKEAWALRRCQWERVVLLVREG
jgi:hypothetical protein